LRNRVPTGLVRVRDAKLVSGVRRLAVCALVELETTVALGRVWELERADPEEFVRAAAARVVTD
jgi:hypothetical protein